MFCPQCGAQIDEGAKFCIQCGTKTGGPVQPVAQTVPQAPVQSPADTVPRGAVTAAAPEAVLVKGLGDAWLFQPNRTLSADKMSGNFEVTLACVRFIPNALLSAFKFSKKDTVVIPVADIVSVEKTGSLPPAIEILVNSGHILKIQGYGAVKKSLIYLSS
jgi:hypothetical protein